MDYSRTREGDIAVLKCIEVLSWENDGVAPVFREIADRLGWSSTSRVANAIARLENLGFVGRRHYRGRTLRILRAVAELEPVFRQRRLSAIAADLVDDVARGDLEINGDLTHFTELRQYVERRHRA